MRVAITGATGFIGQQLVQKHSELGNTIRILTRKSKNESKFSNKVEVFHGDLFIDKTVLNDFVENVDILYHCAAEINSQEKMYDVNVIGTKNLIKAAQGKVKRWVQLSSTGVYGNQKTGEVNELTKEKPQNPYEISKLEADKLVIEAGENNFFDYTILRPSNVFGSNMKNQSLFQLIHSINKNKYFHIGYKKSSANYISVENVIEALILCGLKEEAIGKTFILSDWRSTEYFTKYIASQLNKSIPNFRIPKLPLKILVVFLNKLTPNFPLTTSRIDALTNKCKYNYDLICKTLNYTHIVDMEKGLTLLVESYKRK